MLLPGPEFGSGLLAALAAASLMMPRSRTPILADEISGLTVKESTGWYVAVLVLVADVHGPSPDQPLFDHQIRLINAGDVITAYERALFLGRSEETTYENTFGQRVAWRFAGLHDLVALDGGRPGDGAELYSLRFRAAQALEVMPKEKLTAFWLDSVPDVPVKEWVE